MSKLLLKKILNFMGINDAVFYFLLGKCFSFLVTPVTLSLIVLYLSPAEQGYYYTFSSLLGLSIFFELGLGVVITQFASHEYAHLSWTPEGSLSGDSEALSRIISLLRKSLKWYVIIVTFFVLVILPSGLWFFGRKPESAQIKYSFSWVLLIVFFGLGTCAIPLTSVIAGCGRIGHVQKLRVLQAVAGVICLCGVLVAGGGLFSASVPFIAYCLVILFWLLYNYRGLLRQIWEHNLISEVAISWWREIFPMQWRVAVTWIAVYFTDFLFVPLLFAFRGSVVAGKMGMSLKLTSMIFMVSMAWVNTRLPLFGALVKKKNYRELDRLAKKSSLQAVLVGCLLSITIMLCIVVLKDYFPKYANRVLSGYIVAALCLANLLTVVMAAMAGYLRAHKEEPLMVISVITAFLVAAGCFLSARYFTAEVMVAFYVVVLLLVKMPTIVYILIKKKRQWHQL